MTRGFLAATTSRPVLLLALVAIVTAACQGATIATPGTSPALPPASTGSQAESPSPATPETPGPTTGVPASPAPTAPGTAPAATPGSPTPQTIPFSTAGWRTDFTRTTVDLTEILSGGPPPDGIPPVDEPKFETIEEGKAWLGDWWPVISLEIDGDARAYPIAILIWHEIVNDTVGGVPVVVTFCPLCNTAIVFERTIDGQIHDFGTTGRLRHSDLIMWDRQTESWWQQATGEAIIGSFAGTHLKFVPGQMVAFRDFVAAYPTGTVLSRDTGYSRRYGSNPYPGYDDAGSTPFLFQGVADGRLAPKERVVAVKVGAESVAFPYAELRRANFAQETVGGTPILVLWVSGVASPLDSYDAEGRNIGSAGVFDRRLGDQTLTFHDDGRLGAVDDQTGTLWSITGMGVDGPLAGERLTPVSHVDPFWFAWAAFEPATRIWTEAP